MITIKKVLATALVLCMLAVTLGGCTAAQKTNSEDNTLTITMWTTSESQIMNALESKFPDINFVVNEYAGCNNSLYLKELLQRNQAGDIFFYTTFYNDSDAPKYLVDLSGYPFLTNYDRAILSTLDVDGAIYQIPGPITVRYMVVNKTLFEEKGWKIPENFDEMVAVCKQISEEEPDIVPLGLGSLGMGIIWTLVTSYAQMGTLDTAEGQAAENAYRMGTASFGEAFDEGLDMVGRLIDAGAFRPDEFINDWDVSPKQMGDRVAAMCYVMTSQPLYTTLLSGQAKGNPDFGEHNGDEFIALPLFGSNLKNKGLILGTANTWALSKHLEEPSNEKKLENALRVMEYISSEEGQLAIRSDPASIPAIKDLKSNDIPQFMKNLWNDSTNSIKSFFLYTGYEHIMNETAQVLLDSMRAGSSKGMKEEFIRIADRLNEEFHNGQTSFAAFGYSQDDLSVKQTRHLSCEAFRVASNADIAIASEGGIKYGVLNKIGLAGRLFKGNITTESLTLIIAQKNINVVSVSLTGKEIRDMLENGKIIRGEKGTSESFAYWASGVEIIKKEGVAAQYTIGGKALDDNSVYKVAMLDGDYSKAFAGKHKITDTGVNILTALGDYFKAQKVIEAED